MAPTKKSEVDVAMENMRDEVSKIGVMEQSVEDLKEGLKEIRSRMSVMERLEKQMDESEETRKREFALLFQATLQKHTEEETSCFGQRPGKQIETEEDRSDLFRAGGSGVRSETVTRIGEARREVECEGRHQPLSPTDRQWPQPDDGSDFLTRKLKIPVFNGENPESWVLRV